MKTLKKNIIAGIGRAIGFIIIYATIAVILFGLGIEINLSDFPPSLESEIVSSIIQ